MYPPSPVSSCAHDDFFFEDTRLKERSLSETGLRQIASSIEEDDLPQPLQCRASTINGSALDSATLPQQEEGRLDRIKCILNSEAQASFSQHHKVNGTVNRKMFPDPKYLKLDLQPQPPSKGAGIRGGKCLYGQAGLVSEFLDAKKSIESISQAVQSVSDFMETLKKAIKFDPKTDDITEALISRLEGLMLLIVDLMSRRRLSDMLIPIIQYIKTWSGGTSLILRSIAWIKELFSEEEEEFYDANEPAGSSRNGWFGNGWSGQAGWFETNWMSLTSGFFGKKLASAINLLIIGGMMPEKAEGLLTEEMYKVLNVTNQRKKQPSVFHHLFSTLDWVVDSVIPAFTTGNMSLLLQEADVEEIDKIYRQCLDVVNLNITGQMALAKTKYGVIDEASILMMLVNTSMSIETLKARSKDDPIMVREFQSRLIKLDKLSSDLQAFWHESALRTKPFAVMIRGGSSVGKSTLGTIMSHVISEINEFPQGKEYWCTINGNDKYQSDFRSQHICVMFDDMGNTKPEKCEGNPLFVLIQFINNMHCSALSPEADKKGKMDIRCRIVIVTTNTSNLHASLFSVNPASIMRRFDLIVDVALKPEAVGPGGGLSAKYAGIPMPDAWDLKCGTIVISRSYHDALADQWMVVNKPETNDLATLIEYLADVTPEFFATQEKIVSASSDMHKKEHCKNHPLFCVPCPCCAKLDPAFREKTDDLMADVNVGYCEALAKSRLEVLPEDELTGHVAALSHANNVELAGSSFYDMLMSRTLENQYSCEAQIQPDSQLAGCLDPSEEVTPQDEKENRDTETPTQASVRTRLHGTVQGAVQSLKGVLTKAKAKVEQDPWTHALGAIALMGLAGLGLHAVLAPKPLHGHGAIYSRIAAASQSPRQLIERDDRYRKVYSNVAVYPSASESTTLSQLETKIDRNLHFVKIKPFNPVTSQTEGNTTWCNAFPVGGSEWLFVGHTFKEGLTYHIEMMSHPSVGIKRFSSLVNAANTRPVFGTDAVVVDIPNGGDTTSFAVYMMDSIDESEYTPGTPIFVYHVFKSCMESEEDYVPPSSYKLASKLKEVKQLEVKGIGSYPGFTYDAPTHEGMCGSMIFTAGRNPVLIGMHAAGNVGTGLGAGVMLSKNAILESKKFRQGDIKISEFSPLREEIYGRNVKCLPEAHERNPIHFMEDDINVEVFGQTALPRARFRSEIVPSIIAEKFTELTGIEPKYTAPSKAGTTPSRHRHISVCGAQLPPANPLFVQMAMTDFKTKLASTVFADGSQFKEYVHLLNYEDALNGVDGVRGFDPVNPKTSMSFPLTGAKHKYFVENALKEEMGFVTSKFVKRVENDDGTVRYTYELEFDPEKADVKKEVDDTLQWFFEGKRVNAVFRANLKDEPVSYEKVAKNKIRVFAGAPVALVIVTRMLTLPLIAAMSYFPAEFESAVGVDAAGKDWEYIAEILTCKSGGTRCCDGDYSQFDMRLRPELQKAAYEVLKWCLLKGGIEPELVDLLDGLATENLYPIFEEDGVILKTFGPGPSGHGLTVIINGFSNVLTLRYAYYSMHFCARDGRLEFGDIPLFHEQVSLITYGDDNNYDVSSDEPLFNMLSVSKELEKIGHVYTDATKHVSEVPFKGIDEMSFLKRTFKVHPILKKRVGALDLDSIHKSLMITRKKRRGMTESVAQICAANMAAALGELFLHGEDYYRKYHAWFETIADTYDEEGYQIRAFYNPPTIDELIARYENSTCCYEDAKAFLKPDADGLTQQSGFLDDGDYWVDEPGDALDPILEMDEMSILEAYHLTYHHEFPDEPFIDDEEVEYGNAIVDNLKFRCWLAETERPLADLLQPDYRFRHEFYDELGLKCDYYLDRRAKRDHLYMALRYIMKNLDSAMVIIGTNTVRAVEMLQRMRRRQIRLVVLPEIEKLIWSYLHPQVLFAADSSQGVVMATPNFERDPLGMIYHIFEQQSRVQRVEINGVQI